MLAHVQSSAVLGIDAYQVHVEVDVSNGLPNMKVVLCDSKAYLYLGNEGS